MTRADAARKIRSLLALAAPNSGGTPDERATARRLAERLMCLYGLAEIEAGEKQIAEQIHTQPTAYGFTVVNDDGTTSANVTFTFTQF